MSYRAFVTLFTLIIGVNIYASLPLHTLSYDISNNGVALGNEVRTLTKEGEIYTYTAATQTSGFVKLFFDYQLSVISSFRVTPELSPFHIKSKNQKMALSHKTLVFLFRMTQSKQIPKNGFLRREP